MAAEAASAAGARVDVYDAMPSVGRKFLMAGKGGLNLTHSEPLEAFLSRYGARRAYARAAARAASGPKPCAPGRAGSASTPSSAAPAACFPRA